MGQEGKQTALKEWVESKRFSELPPPNTEVDADADPNLIGIPKVGEEILNGKYLVERVIGIGGMGVVVSAMHKQLKQRVAIKFLAAQMRSPELVDRFVREGQAAVRIKSEHIAPVLDVGVLESGTPYLMMEHLTGADLNDYLIEHRTVPIEDAIDFVLQALDALAVAHSAGIVHRDLKPSNLFLTQRSDGSPLVKVLDFGISKITQTGPDPKSTLTRPGMMLGSPRYMSPEQLRNASSVDHRADIWAMGVVLQELITGTPPYDADTFTALCSAIITDPPTPLRQAAPHAPEELEAIILKCIAKNPADRWQDVGELATALSPLATPESRIIAKRVSKILGHVPGKNKTPPGSYISTKLSPGTPKPTDKTLPLSSGTPPSSGPVSSPLATTGANGRASKAPITDPNVGALAVSTATPGARSNGKTIAIAALALALASGIAFVAFKKSSTTTGSPTPSATVSVAPTVPSVSAPIPSATPTASAEPAVTATVTPSAAPTVTTTPTAPRGRPSAQPRPTAPLTTAAPTASVPVSEEDMLNRRRR